MMNSQNFEQLMNMYGNIKIGCGIAAIILLVAAIVLFFVLKIPTVFSELSGRGAKKAIEEMTAENAGGGLSSSRKIGEDGRRHKKARTGSLGTSKLRKNSGLNTGRLSGGLNGQNTVYTNQGAGEMAMINAGGNETAEMNTGIGETTVMSAGADQTTVMNTGAGETTVMTLGSAETTVMNSEMMQQTAPESDMTQPMNGEGVNETMVLESILPPPGKYFSGKDKNSGFVIERSIVEIHTNEVI